MTKPEDVGPRPAGTLIRQIKKATHCKFSAEPDPRIVLDGL
jgi:hypothetical protein